MIHLTLRPRAGLPGSAETVVAVNGEVLTVDGIDFDLGASGIEEGDVAWPEGDHPFTAPIKRVDGVLHCTITVRLSDSAAYDQPTGLEHWTIPDAEGPITIPAVREGAA